MLLVLDRSGLVTGYATTELSHPYPEPTIGMDYLGVCERAGGSALTVAQAVRKVLDGESQVHPIECADPRTGVPLRVVVRRLTPAGAAVTLERMKPERAQPSDDRQVATKQLRLLLDQFPVPCISTDSEFRLEYLNPAAESLFGYESDEIRGREPFGLITPPEYNDFVRELFRMLSRGEYLGTSLGENVTKSGRRFLSEWTNARFLDLDGTFVGLISVCQDVTERTRVRHALEHSEQRYRSLVECLPDAILVTRGLTVTYANGAAAKLLGTATASGLVGAALPDLLHPESRHVITETGDVAPLGASQRVRLVSAREEIVPGEISAVPLADDADAPGSLIVLRDLSERDALERELRQQHRLEVVGRLAGGVAHDFNNMLTVILSACSLLSTRQLDDGKARQEVELIRGAAEASAALTGQLLAFARQQAVEPTLLALNEIIERAEPLLRHVLGEHNDLELVTEPRLWPVRADGRLIEQVVINLAANARDAMPNGGRLTITTKNVERAADGALQPQGAQPGRYAMLSVADTGVGMDRDTLARVFEPFFTTKETGRGTGLGLASCYGIVAQAGGHIEAQSNPGAGAIFSVYLPAVAAPDQPVTADAARVRRIGGQGGSETILLVDDNLAVRSVAARVLEHAGYDVIQARGATEALDCAGAFQGEIHLLITDVVMPGMSGTELAPRVLGQRPDIAVIYMSGYADHVDAADPTTRSETRFLPKPFTPQTLLDIVRQALDCRVQSSSRE